MWGGIQGVGIGMVLGSHEVTVLLLVLFQGGCVGGIKEEGIR